MTVPRLELCATVLAVEVTDLVLGEEAIKPDSITYYSDSKVVWGYVTNETRRKSLSPEQWCYVRTQLNPVDLSTWSVKADELRYSAWLFGPEFLRHQVLLNDPEEESVVESPAVDPEVRPDKKVLATQVRKDVSLGTNRFTRFSIWSNLLKGVSRLIRVAQSYKRSNDRGKISPETSDETALKPAAESVVKTRYRAQLVIFKMVQREAFSAELDNLQSKTKLAKGSVLAKLCTLIGTAGLLRVGGRLDRADLSVEERHPVVILPGSYHVTTLLVKHLHGEVKHQGRHFTQGMIRAKGYLVIGGKRIVNRIIHQCMTCRNLRGKQLHQKMADLPVQRLTPAPPFTYVGLDVFGPWQVVTRRTREGVACNKRWAVIFTCLTVRAVHIELIESMDTSSFINALCRFLAVRGPVAELRSDCGTNFVGARNELEAVLKEMNKKDIEVFLNQQGCEWIFNPPHASHADGMWERMIRISRKILDSMLLELRSKHLTHKVLSTLMAEVAAIVNNRPLVPV